MFKKNLLLMLVVFVLLVFGCAAKETTPPKENTMNKENTATTTSKDTTAPKVIDTMPTNGANGVDPALTQITVTFNETMTDKSWSWAYNDKNKFPELGGQPSFNDDKTICTLPVKLKPSKEYEIFINSDQLKNFKDKAGNPVEPFKLTFKTREK